MSADRARFLQGSQRFRSLVPRGLLNNYHLTGLGMNRVRREEGHSLLAKQCYSEYIDHEDIEV